MYYNINCTKKQFELKITVDIFLFCDIIKSEEQMKNLENVSSPSELTYEDYLSYKIMIDATKMKVFGKKEFLYSLPLLFGLASLGLVALSSFCLMLSVPLLCFGAFFMTVSCHSMYVNFCKKADNKKYIQEYKRMAKSKKLQHVEKLMCEYEKSGKFVEDKLRYEIGQLKKKIKQSNAKSEKNLVSNLLERELSEKNHLLNEITKQNKANYVKLNINQVNNDFNEELKI